MRIAHTRWCWLAHDLQGDRLRDLDEGVLRKPFLSETGGNPLVALFVRDLPFDLESLGLSEQVQGTRSALKPRFLSGGDLLGGEHLIRFGTSSYLVGVPIRMGNCMGCSLSIFK